MRGIVFYGSTGKFTWRMLATVLAGEGICIMLGALVARGLAATDAARARRHTSSSVWASACSPSSRQACSGGRGGSPSAGACRR